MKPTLNPIQTFLKELNGILKNEYFTKSDSDFRRIAMNRVNFDLSTPLLKHFIACDENGEPIEKPTIDFFDKNYGNLPDEVLKQAKQFQQAQKQVLFEGWEIVDIKDSNLYSKGICLTDGFFIFWYNKEFNEWQLSRGIQSYSDLTKYQLQTNNNFKELIYGK